MGIFSKYAGEDGFGADGFDRFARQNGGGPTTRLPGSRFFGYPLGYGYRLRGGKLVPDIEVAPAPVDEGPAFAGTASAGGPAGAPPAGLGPFDSAPRTTSINPFGLPYQGPQTTKRVATFGPFSPESIPRF